MAAPVVGGDTGDMSTAHRGWVVDLAFGGIVGGITGAIVAVNVVIFSGMEEGYETTIPEMMRQNVFVGVLVMAILMAGPIAGVMVARRMRRRRIVVTEATEQDVAAIAVFFREAWAMTGSDAPGWAGASEEAIAELTRPEVLRDRVGGPQRRMFLARDRDRVVGFSATRIGAGGGAELVGIVVLQEMLGRGIGTPLLTTAVDRLRADGVEWVMVRTEADNERAIGFYRARGFEGDRRVVDDVEGTMVELVELTRSL